MRQRDKEKLTYEAALSEEKRLTRKLADLIINNSQLEGIKINTVNVQQDIGRVLSLRDILPANHD